ncbi:hypothetical protein CHARACLAT_017948 [Characodon lateralis]|uniref:Uncharacterized protein n=1 Tax=Characodon lateralis TaxID=208331 RepID=A0ABU7EUJ6_9TELE|nr:hypothetical protein [Characodon lateralis]
MEDYMRVARQHVYALVFCLLRPFKLSRRVGILSLEHTVCGNWTLFLAWLPPLQNLQTVSVQPVHPPSLIWTNGALQPSQRRLTPQTRTCLPPQRIDHPLTVSIDLRIE